MNALAAVVASAVCMAAPIHHPVAGASPYVQVGPLKGLVTLPFDSYRGRFALRAGGMRTDTLSQKIAWFPTAGADVGATLVVTGRSLSSPHRSFRQAFPAALDQPVFPTNIDVPSRGCWRLTFTSGKTSASIVAWVRPRLR